MKKVPFMNEEQEARMKAKAIEEAERLMPELKVLFRGTKEGTEFEAAYKVASEKHREHGEYWFAMVMYLYGVEQGSKKKKSHAKKLKLSAV